MSERRGGAFQACSKSWWTIWPAEVRTWGHRTWPGDPIQGLSWCWCPLKGEQSQRKRSKYPQKINSPKAGLSLPRWTFWLLPGYAGPASWAEHTCLHEWVRPQIVPSVWGQLRGVLLGLGIQHGGGLVQKGRGGLYVPVCLVGCCLVDCWWSCTLSERQCRTSAQTHGVS